MDNPQALFIGLGIGAMFVTIALFQNISRARGTTWDGTVVDKKIEHGQRKHHTSNNEYYWEDYTDYVVHIRSDANGKLISCVMKG